MPAGWRRPRATASPTVVIESKPFGKDRAASRRCCSAALDENKVDLICLGGFMRLFTAEFVQRWYGKMLNIHPSLLPSFPGLDPHGQALQAGVKISGATVHFVIPETDAGPILMQGAVVVRRRRYGRRRCRRASSGSSIASIPEALRLLASGKVRLEGDICKIADGSDATAR